MKAMTATSSFPTIMAAIALATGTACAPSDPGAASFDVTAQASIWERFEEIEGTPPAVGILNLLADERTDLAVLDGEVRLPRDAAENLIAHRNGTDSVFGTDDDDPFDSLLEVVESDGVSAWAGILQALGDYATERGHVPTGDEYLATFDGVPFTVREADAVLGLVDGASAEGLAALLGPAAAQAITRARPIRSVFVLSQLDGIGAAELEELEHASEE
jgi:hypothetical protein